jgi:hypothetical protein
MKNTFTASHALIVDYLLTFAMSRILDGENDEYPKTFGALVGFVQSSFRDSGRHPIPGDLIRLESCPASKWRLSWLKQVEPLAGGDKRYLCQSIVDGELCWWSNVGVSYFHRLTTSRHPEWRWNDEQHAFRAKWIKACKRHDPYIYLPIDPDFNADGSAVVGTRVRHGIGTERPTRIVQNWKRATLKALGEHYLSMVDEHKAMTQKQAAQ